MENFSTFDPQDVIVVFAGVVIRGYATGSFVEVERDEDLYKKDVGATGDVVRMRSRNKCGMVKVTLQAQSPVNDALSQLALIDEGGNVGYGPLLLRHNNGTTFMSSSVAWIRKRPTSTFGTDEMTREWIIDCADLIENVGGFVSPGL
jgi:hypothetical protein